MGEDVTYQNIIFTKLKIIQTCGLWGEDFKYISQSETGIVNGSNVFARSRLNGKDIVFRNSRVTIHLTSFSPLAMLARFSWRHADSFNLMQIVIAALIKMCVTKTCFVEKYKHKIDVFRPSHVQRDLTKIISTILQIIWTCSFREDLL